MRNKMRKNYVLECCVDSAVSALTAVENGADRLELCSNLIIGGTTPTLALYQTVRAHTATKIHALIRPRFGDFLYDDLELEVMRREVEQFRENGADGVVIGCLKSDGRLDIEQMKLLIDAAGPMHITLHRAFDMCLNPFEALENAVTLGVQTILTSGRQDSCLAGLPLLLELEKAADGRITIMPGAGVNAQAIQTLRRETDFTCFHMSGKKLLESSMSYRNDQVHMGLPGMNEYEVITTDAAAVKAANAALE